MSKKTKYPAYSGGAVTINGQNVATTRKEGNNIVSDYTMSDAEKNMQKALQNNMASSMQNLFSISDNERQQWQNQLDTLKKQGIQNINNIYTPMETSLQNNIAARFGNLDNSIFLQNLKNITNNKAQAVAGLSDLLSTKQNDLYTQEIQNRMNLINMMNSWNTSFNNQILQYLNMANGNSAAGNQYNQNAYNAALQDSSSWQSPLSNAAGVGLTAASLATGNPYIALMAGSMLKSI